MSQCIVSNPWMTEDWTRCVMFLPEARFRMFRLSARLHSAKEVLICLRGTKPNVDNRASHEYFLFTAKSEIDCQRYGSSSGVDIVLQEKKKRRTKYDREDEKAIKGVDSRGSEVFLCHDVMRAVSWFVCDSHPCLLYDPPSLKSCVAHLCTSNPDSYTRIGDWNGLRGRNSSSAHFRCSSPDVVSLAYSHYDNT